MMYNRSTPINGHYLHIAPFEKALQTLSHKPIIERIIENGAIEGEQKRESRPPKYLPLNPRNNSERVKEQIRC